MLYYVDTLLYVYIYITYILYIVYLIYYLCILSKCLRPTGTHPWGARVARSCKLGPKILQVGSQNPPSWAPKSTKLGSKIKKNQSWEGSGGGLGAILAPRGTKTPSKRLPAKLTKMVLVGFGAILGPKIDKNLLKNQSKNH